MATPRSLTDEQVITALRAKPQGIAELIKTLDSSDKTVRRYVYGLVTAGKVEIIETLRLANGNKKPIYGLPGAQMPPDEPEDLPEVEPEKATPEEVQQAPRFDLSAFPPKVQKAFRDPLCRLVMFEGRRYERPSTKQTNEVI